MGSLPQVIRKANVLTSRWLETKSAVSGEKCANGACTSIDLVNVN